MEQILIDALRMAPDKNIQAILLETYVQEYGPISDENGENIRQILMEENSIPLCCRSCSNHPKNGGSGICHCILGGIKING